MVSRARAATAAVLAAAVVLSGCGSDAERPAPPPPRLPFEVAQRLAADSDSVAAALIARDTCGALDKALRLQRDTIKAINDRRVPGAFEEQLSASVNDLVNRIECVQMEDDEGDRGRGKGKAKDRDKDKHKGKDKGEEGD